MKTDYYTISNVGYKRKNNEDYMLVAAELGLYMLADGMGGHLGGEEASKLALTTIKRFFEENPNITEEEINKLQEFPDSLSLSARKLSYAIIKANADIIKKAETDPDLNGMGTTIVAIHESLGDLYLSHVGDSRIYMLRDGTFRQVTEDHSVFNEEKKRGILSVAQLKEMPFGKRLVRALGHMDKSLVDLQVVHPQRGDVFLLCSDGLTDMVEDEGIEQTLKESSEDMEKAGNELVRKALNGGGADNISIVLLRINEL
ncbi:MAG: PP2C family protein-serine/threonine phosphatase [Nitrospinota bacterium]